MNDYEAATAFLGEWGPYQQRLFFLLCVTVIPNGLSALSVVFLADTPQHQCLVPAHVNLTAAWRNFSIPLEEQSHSGALVPSKCSRYKLHDLLRFSEEGLLPGVDVNLSSVPTEGCLDGWEYDKSLYTATIVSEWDIVCDDSWKKPLTSSVFFCGVLFGSIISGQVSDRFGRKLVLFGTLGIQTVVTFIQVFSPSWMVFCALFFLVGLGQISNYLAAFVLGMELLGPRVRRFYSTAGVNIFFALGYMLLPLLASFLRSWRWLLVGLSVPCFLMLPLWWYIPESPRWLISQGRREEAEAILKSAAKRNRIEPPQIILASLEKEHQSEEKQANNICELLRSPNIRWISITLWLVWTNMTIAYFALSLNTSNLHGNTFLNGFLSAVVELPAYTLSWLLFRSFSRRLTIFSTLFMGGVFLLVIQAIPADHIYIALTLEMMGKFSVTTAFSIVYAYSAELYPTVLRNTAVGACSMASRIGNITAPYFIYLRTYSISLPYILIGTLSTLAGLLSLLLPESYGMPLPDTITHMQPFTGCCHKTIYTLTRTKEEENTTERKSSDVS